MTSPLSLLSIPPKAGEGGKEGGEVKRIMPDKKRRIVILSEGYFGDLEAKTASGLLMYRQLFSPSPLGGD